MAMWQLQKEFRFESSHFLPNHDGKCRRLHGHSWLGTVYVQGDHLHPQGGPKGGMLIDYGDIKAALEPIVDMLDHHHLNYIPGLDNPTSENVARLVYTYLKDSPIGYALAAVKIEETCTARCLYTERELSLS